jgi:hypothetical protein
MGDEKLTNQLVAYMEITSNHYKGGPFGCSAEGSPMGILQEGFETASHPSSNPSPAHMFSVFKIL